MTMKELAKRANVSVSTVSKAFCDSDDISRETKEHVLRLAKELGCFGKYFKEKFHKRIIAIVCPEFGSSYYAGFIEKLQAHIERAGGITLVSSDGFQAAKQAELIEYYASYLKVDGLIVFGLHTNFKKGYTTPTVSLFSSSDAQVDSVNIDMESAINDAVRLLLHYGHKSIAFLGERLTTTKSQAFADACRAHGYHDFTVIESTYRFEEAGEDAAIKLLAQRQDVTAIICAYDNIALGAMRQFKKSGKQIPQDISVIGIDNIPISGHAETSLTSIDTDPDEICQIAWDLLQKKIQSPHFKSRQAITIKPNLIERESVSLCKNSEEL